ncbi:MAG: hypothetical protein WAV41_06095 [Microgenomates group bacterium]
MLGANIQPDKYLKAAREVIELGLNDGLDEIYRRNNINSQSEKWRVTMKLPTAAVLSVRKLPIDPKNLLGQ